MKTFRQHTPELSPVLRTISLYFFFSQRKFTVRKVKSQGQSGPPSHRESMTTAEMPSPSLNRQGRQRPRVNTWGCLHVDMQTAAYTCNHRPRVLYKFSSDTEKVRLVTLHRQSAHFALETRCLWTPTRGLSDLSYANLPSRKQGLTVAAIDLFSEDKHLIWWRSVTCIYSCPFPFSTPPPCRNTCRHGTC